MKQTITLLFAFFTKKHELVVLTEHKNSMIG